MSLRQFIVWIDEHEARIVRVHAGLASVTAIHSTVTHETPKSTANDEHAVDESDAFFERLARELDTADEILIVEPSAIKTGFAKFMHRNQHAIDPRIVGVELISDPDASYIAAYAKLFFK